MILSDLFRNLRASVAQNVRPTMCTNVLWDNNNTEFEGGRQNIWVSHSHV